MENFITGYPANESAMREAVAAVLGADAGGPFFERLLDRFFSAGGRGVPGVARRELRAAADQPAPFRERRAPFEWLSEGFERLSRAVALLGDAGIHSVIDLHAVPGCQNQHWHSDNPTHVAAFWRTRTSWSARRRCGCSWRRASRATRGWRATTCSTSRPTRPAPSSGRGTTRTVAAIREVDPDHILFLDGNTYSTDFSAFGEPYENAIYACHDYARGGDGVRRRRTRAMPRGAGGEVPRAHGLPARDGHADLGGGVRAGLHRRAGARRARAGGARRPALDLRALRRRLVAVDLQGRRAAGPRLRARRQPVHAALRRRSSSARRGSGVDSWGSTDRELPELVEPIHAFIARRVPGLGAVPVERALLDRRPRAPHPLRPGDAAVLRGAVPRARRRGARRAGGLVQPRVVRAPRAPVRPRRRPHGASLSR